MARQIVILALVFFAFAGMSSAAATAPTEHPPAIPAEGPESSETVGTTDGTEDAAPVGGPVPDGAFPTVSTDAPSESPNKNGASGLHLSAIAGFAATAAVSTFFF